MDENKLYESLATHLDQGVMGSPKSPALTEIIKILFPVEEAEIAVKLPMQNRTLSELKEIFPEKAETLEDILAHMVKRGTVFTSQRPGQERKYRLLPSVVGWAETPFWSGKDTDDTRKLAPLWLKYREEAFGQELARGDMPVMRVLPISRTLRNSSEVLPFEALKPIVEEQSFCAVAHCPCRLMKRSVGEGCDHSLVNCMHFGAMGRHMVEQGMAREVTTDEALKILKEANEEGLVHSVDNIEGYTRTICNCCGCCCVFLDTKKKMGIHAFSPSNYVARVDGELCAACGTCEERCPMGAVTVGDEDVAEVDEDLCIGCGVCTPTCAAEAVDLARRGEVKRPPQISDFLATRYKSA
jgi:Pyruvate/2-oxoacid:ferredoxin oxidoreductase delta subunit